MSAEKQLTDQVLNRIRSHPEDLRNVPPESVEWLISKVDGRRKHKLLTKALKKQIPALYSQDGAEDPTVYCKLFSIRSSSSWYVLEFDGEDTLFTYHVNEATGEGEFGYSSYLELATLTFGPGVPMIERECYESTPYPLSKVRKP